MYDVDNFPEGRAICIHSYMLTVFIKGRVGVFPRYKISHSKVRMFPSYSVPVVTRKNKRLTCALIPSLLRKTGIFQLV